MAALLLLSLANAFNIADRILLGVVQEPIKAEFRLTDFQLGLLGGPAFAILYSVLGLFIAWLADRKNRRTIVACALAMFSLMTAACGLAQNYIHLLLSRMGVSIGEAGVGAPALSLISDNYSQSRRAMAMSIYAVGGPLGAVLATIGGGLVAQSMGWRASFLIFGAAGLMLALLIAIFVSDTANRAAKGPVPLYGEVLRFIARRRTVVHICIAAAFANACGMAIMQYLASFFIRVHGLSLAQASSVLGIGALAGAMGTFLAGYMGDKMSNRSPGSSPLVCSVLFLIAAPMYIFSFWTPLLWVAVVGYLIAAACLNGYPGVSYAALSSVVPSTMRATVIAVYGLASHLVGYSLGPPIAGKISDLVAASSMASKGLDPEYCMANPAVAACVASSGEGLRWGLTIACTLLLATALFFWLAARRMREEIVDEREPVPAA